LDKKKENQLILESKRYGLVRTWFGFQGGYKEKALVAKKLWTFCRNLNLRAFFHYRGR